MDLDAAMIVVDDKGKKCDHVSFGRKNGDNNAIRHL
eukprot:gene11755-20119_t